MYLVLLGPPGAGKGTQAERLHEILKLPHIASGDLFRENLREQTELGQLAKTYMDRGELVPDDVTIGMVQDRLDRPDAQQGAILDGFPRTLVQAQGLDDILADRATTLDRVIYISLSDDEIVRRLCGRWICSQCQAPFHSHYNPPAKMGICDVCGGKLYQREDDQPETVRARLKVYHARTAPLIEHYRSAGLLREVDGQGTIDQVTQLLVKAL